MAESESQRPGPGNHGRVPIVRGLLVVGLTATVLAGGVWLASRPSGRDRVGESASTEAGSPRLAASSAGGAFVGSAKCATCHEAEAESHGLTTHARALVEIDLDREPPDVTFEHAPSHRRYQVERDAGRLVHRESLMVEGEHALHSHAVRYRMGSGHFGRGYFCDIDGFLIESPISWFEPRKNWGMSPGYDNPHHESFARAVSTSCLQCHSGRLEIEDDNEFRPKIVEFGIGCERCHGPGEFHVAYHSGDSQQRAGGSDPIVNPRQLARDLSEDVCSQCHLQGDVSVPGLEKRETDFRPGLKLVDFRQEYRIVTQDSGMRIAGHAEQLHLSHCWQKSGSLTCTTCHLPHKTLPAEDRPGHYRRICLECHAEPGCPLPVDERTQRAGDDCTKCHMPAAGTEVPHVAFTHHRIGRHEEPSNEVGKRASPRLVPLQDLSAASEEERQRSLGLAYLQLHRRAASRLDGPTPFQNLAIELLARLPATFADLPVEAGLAELEFRGRQWQSSEARAHRVLDAEHASAGDRAAAHSVLAERALQQRNFEQGRTHFRELTRLRYSARDHFYLGVCENQCGNSEAAIAALRDSLRIEPVQDGAGDVLADILEKQGKVAEAREMRWGSGLMRRVIRPGAP